MTAMNGQCSTKTDSHIHVIGVADMVRNALTCFMGAIKRRFQTSTSYEDAVFECWVCEGTGSIEDEYIVGGRFSNGDPWQGYETEIVSCSTCSGEGSVGYFDLPVGVDECQLKRL
jgi:hypothetical protein